MMKKKRREEEEEEEKGECVEAHTYPNLLIIFQHCMYRCCPT